MNEQENLTETPEEKFPAVFAVGFALLLIIAVFAEFTAKPGDIPDNADVKTGDNSSGVSVVAEGGGNGLNSLFVSENAEEPEANENTSNGAYIPESTDEPEAGEPPQDNAQSAPSVFSDFVNELESDYRQYAITDDYVYYIDGGRIRGADFCRLDTDGVKLVLAQDVSGFRFCGDYIYLFTRVFRDNFSFDDFDLYRINADGTNRIFIAEHISDFWIIENYIYFKHNYGLFNELYKNMYITKTNLDGTDSIPIAHRINGHVFTDFDSERLYGENFSTESGCPADGSEKVQILSLDGWDFADGEWAYYTTTACLKYERITPSRSN